MPKARQYRFERFVLSCARRTLSRDGCHIPLIPRYFDLLVLLLERRDQAVHRHEIFDRVWSDVVVSDGALSQAVRTLRRALDDDPREPRYIRTVSRHGYQFIGTGVIEADDGPESASVPGSASESSTAAGVPNRETSAGGAFERSLAALLADDGGNGDSDPRRDAAETLHALGTAAALQRLDRRPGHERARALLRDARWDVPGAGPVPILGQPGAARAGLYLVILRLRRALRDVESRWLGAALGGASAGAAAGVAGGLTLWLGPGSRATASVPVALGLLGALVGGVGAAGVGAGLAAAEAVFRSFRGLMLVLFGALSGGATGGLAHVFARFMLEGVFGRDLTPLGGGIEGLVIGGGAGLGFALATHPESGGMAAPRRLHRVLVSLVTGIACSAAAAALGAAGYHLGAMSLDFMARTFPGSQVGLDPLARLLGESTAGPLTCTVISGGEGLFFGTGLAFGLTRRPR